MHRNQLADSNLASGLVFDGQSRKIMQVNPLKMCVYLIEDISIFKEINDLNKIIALIAEKIGL